MTIIISRSRLLDSRLERLMDLNTLCTYYTYTYTYIHREREGGERERERERGGEREREYINRSQFDLRNGIKLKNCLESIRSVSFRQRHC